MGQLLVRTARRLFGREVLNNNMYGHAAVFREFCGLRYPVPIRGLLQHGWSFGPGLTLYDQNDGWLAKSTRLYLWNHRNKGDSYDQGYHNVKVIGSPLLYLPPISKPARPEPRSLLLFPSHSAKSEPFCDDAKTIFSRYLDEIEPMYESFSSVIVCLYFREFDNPDVRRELADRGLEVTTVGHRDQTPDFTKRLRNLMLQSEYISTNSYSTSLFYALYLGRKAFTHGQTFANRFGPKKMDSLTAHETMKRRYPQLEWERFDDTTDEAIGAEEIGAEFMRSPEELRADFGWSAPQQVWTAGRRVGEYLRRNNPGPRTDH